MLSPETEIKVISGSGALEGSCRDFRAGKLRPDSPDDLRRLLRGEGLKRLESFVFELLMQRALRHYCGQMPLAVGWYVLPINGQDAGLWVRLVTDTLGPVDEALINLLKDRGCSILKVQWSREGTGVTGAWYKEESWEAERDLDDLLLERFKSRGRVRELQKPASENRAEALCLQLFQRLEPAELRSLTLSRLLINCYLIPFTRSQPMDIDAVVLNEKGMLRFVEFKRKYPARNMRFGVDVQPHAALVRWLDISGHTLSNIILVDPCWNKNISPLHLLEGGAMKYARWVGAHLEPSFFEGALMTTSGEDSGMHELAREQEKVRVDRYMDLGLGLKPRGLKPFLNGEYLPHTSANELTRDRDAATEAGHCR